MTARERERRLTSASEAFMRGKLSAQEFECIERENMPDYDAAARALARLRPGIVARLVTFCRRLLVEDERG